MCVCASVRLCTYCVSFRVFIFDFAKCYVHDPQNNCSVTTIGHALAALLISVQIYHTHKMEVEFQRSILKKEVPSSGI